MQEYSDVAGVASRYSEYVDHLNSLNEKDKKAFNDEKFKKRLVSNLNESSLDKAMSYIQKHF